MGLLSQIADGMVHTDAEGRRVFCYGTIFTKKRCVFVNGEQERDLRRTYEWAFAAFIIGIVVLAPATSFWIRLAILLPVWFVFIEIRLRRRMAALPSAPESSRRSQRQLALNGAKAAGRPVLWFELIFCVAIGLVSVSPLIQFEELGWKKYGAYGLITILAMKSRVITL